MTSKGHSPIVAFLSGAGPAANGDHLEDVLSFSDREIEARHDFIQWLFPLETRSTAVPSSPVLTLDDVALIQDSEICQSNLIRAAERMMEFFSGNDHWLASFDHNHKRITRIIRSLSILVSQLEAERFYKAIMSRVAQSGAKVDPVSQRYWRDAVGSR